jgi:hypothetical protein
LPADKNEPNNVNSQFLTLIAPISVEAAREGAFLEIMANLEDLHYEFEVTRFRDHIGYVSLICNEHMKVHIGTAYDKDRNALPMTTWHEYHETARDYFATYNHGIAGYYSFQAEFELIHNEWDPEADEDSPRFIDHGDATIGTIQYAAHNFQEFIEDAIRNLSIMFNVEIYPKRIPLKREIA